MLSVRQHFKIAESAVTVCYPMLSTHLPLSHALCSVCTLIILTVCLVYAKKHANLDKVQKRTKLLSNALCLLIILNFYSVYAKQHPKFDKVPN